MITLSNITAYMGILKLRGCVDSWNIVSICHINLLMFMFLLFTCPQLCFALCESRETCPCPFANVFRPYARRILLCYFLEFWTVALVFCCFMMFFNLYIVDPTINLNCILPISHFVCLFLACSVWQAAVACLHGVGLRFWQACWKTWITYCTRNLKQSNRTTFQLKTLSST